MQDHNPPHDRKPEPLPAPDLPRHRRLLGFRPHIWIGGLVLIAILFLYLLLIVRPGAGPTQPNADPSSTSTPATPSR